MRKTDRKVELIRRLQEELDRRTQIENEAVDLISRGECEKAHTLLSMLDDNIVKEISDELDYLEEDVAPETGLQEKIRIDIHADHVVFETGGRDVLNTTRIMEGYMKAAGKGEKMFFKRDVEPMAERPKNKGVR